MGSLFSRRTGTGHKPLAKSDHATAGAQLQAARKAARERYIAIAAAMKAEAGITRHHHFNKIGGLAWSGTGRILAPKGVTRRQLYVLAHECGHNVLHGSAIGMAKPAHVKEHEAETYAHRAFARYGLDVPKKSAQWSRAYVGLWIMKDQAAGVAICPSAADWAAGRRSPHDPLPSVDGQPPNDFSKSIDRFIAKGVKIAQQDDDKMKRLQALVGNVATNSPDFEQLVPEITILIPIVWAEHPSASQEQVVKWAYQLAKANFDRVHKSATVEISSTPPRQTQQHTVSIVQDALPNACATCWFYVAHHWEKDWKHGRCEAFAWKCEGVRYHAEFCKNGVAWRPNPKLVKQYSYQEHRGFWARLGDAIIDRISGRYRMRATLEEEAKPAKSKVVKIENRLKVW